MHLSIDNEIFPFKNGQEQIKSNSDSINFTLSRLSRLFPYKRMKVFFFFIIMVRTAYVIRICSMKSETNLFFMKI